MSEINVSFGPPAAAAQPGAKSLILRLPVSMILTAAAVVVGATVWGLIAYFTNSIFVFIPVVIGFGIAVAMTFPFKRVPWWLALALFLPCLALTVFSVLLGDYLYYTLLAMKELQLSAGDAVLTVAVNYIDIAVESGDGLASLGFAVLGAIIGFVRTIRK